MSRKRLIVMKFGGTSVGSAERFRQCAEIVREAAENDSIIVVVSAVAGVTDLILKTIEAARQGDTAATETALYTKRGDCRPRSQRFARRQLLGPSVAVRIAPKSCGGGSTCARVCRVPRTCETPETSGVQRSHPFTWKSKAACSAG